MTAKSILIVDYGVGNIFNIKRAFETLGASVSISHELSAIKRADRIVLPGVGAFAAGMAGLREFNLIEPLKEAALVRKVPFFGVCLGMQLLMDHSEENGRWEGLGLIAGSVKRLTPEVASAPVSTCKVPHMGWNTIHAPQLRDDTPNTGTILSALTLPEYFYFVHSYHVTPLDPTHSIAETFYGGQRFCSALSSENLSGCQFHPERSGEAGLRILRSFLYEIY